MQNTRQREWRQIASQQLGELDITIAICLGSKCPELVELEEGHLIDKKGEKAKEMLEACRDAGLDPLVTSAYRSPLKQAWLLIRKTAVLLNRGEKPTKAWSSAKKLVALAKKLVALPGISEHEMGVAFDACLKQRTEKANAEVQRQLADNS